MRDKHGFRFRDWQICKDGRAFRKHIHTLVRKFPKQEMFSLIDQINRTLNSILLNVAEGSNKSTDKDIRTYALSVIPVKTGIQSMQYKPGFQPPLE